jgi:hypothetical protein
MQNYSVSALEHSVKIAGDHGYRIEGDTAFLNAEVAILGVDAEPTGWALQLWACGQPHEGGAISGIKIAEAPVELRFSTDSPPLRLHAESFAHLPAQQGEYSMVLVLASGVPGAFERVHDFANYPQRQWFVVPHLDGDVGYSIDGDEIVLKVERVRNPRAHGNLSGSLTLELWALAGPYVTGPFEGTLLARFELGQIAGQGSLEQLERRIAFSQPPPGEWQVVLALREWTEAAGFVTRDFCNFFVPLRGAASPPKIAPDAPPSREEIALAAYYRYLARPHDRGSALDDWLQAEREIIWARTSAAAA